MDNKLQDKMFAEIQRRAALYAIDNQKLSAGDVLYVANAMLIGASIATEYLTESFNPVEVER